MFAVSREVDGKSGEESEKSGGGDERGREGGDFAVRAEEGQANAGFGEGGDLSDFAVGITFSVSEPE